MKIIRQFIQLESSAGLILFAAAFLALILNNSPAQHFYEQLFSPPVEWFINDILMSIFFFLIGLEIKREMVVGELNSTAKILLPAIAALGGMIFPALIYVACNWHHPESLRGWAIPTATDIAFTLGVISLLGSRIPSSLKVFLLALAIFDDIGAIIIITLFYASQFIWAYLSIAAVLLAFAIPLEKAKSIEHYLHPWVAFLILPLFALANTGISLHSVNFHTLTHGITLGIIAGLFLGKQLGVFSAVWLAVKSGWVPKHHRWRDIYGIAVLCGIGFTMSLFIGNLAFANPAFTDLVRLGVLSGSILSGIVGYCLLRR